MEYDSPYPSTGSSLAEQGKALNMPTLKFRLEQAVKDAESRLKDAQEARDILDKNPDLEKLLNIMQRGRF